MPTNGKFTPELIRSLKASLKHLDSLLLLSDEEEEWVNKLKEHIRAKIAEMENE